MKLLVFIAKGFETIDEISVDDYDALTIPGGFEEFGFYEEAYDEKIRMSSFDYIPIE